LRLGTQALISHTYEANNGNLSRSDYGNGDYYVPTYDAIDRLHSVSYNGVESYNWEYGADGRVGLHNDLVNGVTWMYEYANDGSLTSVVGDNGERFVYTYEPSTGKLLTRTVYDGTASRTTTYNYSDHTNGEKANLIESVVLPTATVTYDYDDFYRASHDVEVNGSDILTTDYTFRNGSAANSTSLMVESILINGNNWANKFSCAYDSNGNIEILYDYSVPRGKYYYDELNQLVRENNMWLSKTITYTYDSGGNIQTVKEYSYTAGSLDGVTPTATYTYVYGDNNWKDKLTSYNGNAITYDAIGNPLSYYNGFTFDWQNGRQLAGVTGNSMTASYKYNSDGIRTSKTVNGVTTQYTLEGDRVVMETNGTDTLWYYYDASGSLTGFELNGTAYFYVKNLQGDIIAIVNSSGTKVVEYLYDSWGKLISTTGSLASTVGVKNPYRYRGYRYDTETGLYYLQSRYYDPVAKRFVNADGYASTGQGVLGNNMFAYCLNNPVSCFDPQGRWTVSISFGVDATFFCVGASFSINFAIDDDFNFAIQCSYSSPTFIDDGTFNVGIADVGGGVSVQYTNDDTVYDLEGSSICLGATYGAGPYVGGDVVWSGKTMDDLAQLYEPPNGFQITGGYGGGVDVHLRQTKTYTRISFSLYEKVDK